MEEQQFFDASTVNDLETARLALRWALERIHKMSEESALAKQANEALSTDNRKLHEEVGILEHQEKALEETKQSLLERLRVQAEVVRAKERDLENEQRLIDEQVRAKEAEFRRKFEKLEEDLLKHNREVLSREEAALDEKFE